jgi:hypothetical protein
MSYPLAERIRDILEEPGVLVDGEVEDMVEAILDAVSRAAEELTP